MSTLLKLLYASALIATVLCPWPIAAVSHAQKPASATSNPAVVPKGRLSEAWWAKRHKAIVAGLHSHADSRLLLIGDSITSNYDDAALPDRNFQPVWQQYYAPRKALNLGFNGDTTANVLWRLDHGEVNGLHPKLAILLIGTNNTASGQTAEQTEAGINAVIADLERHLPRTKILLLGILPTRLPAKDRDFDVNSYLGRHYAGGEDPLVSYIDISVVFYAGSVLDDSLFYDNSFTPPQPSLHPNMLGQQRMASAIEPMVARLMDEKPIKPSASLIESSTRP